MFTRIFDPAIKLSLTVVEALYLIYRLLKKKSENLDLLQIYGSGLKSYEAFRYIGCFIVLPRQLIIHINCKFYFPLLVMILLWIDRWATRIRIVVSCWLKNTKTQFSFESKLHFGIGCNILTWILTNDFVWTMCLLFDVSMNKWFFVVLNVNYYMVRTVVTPSPTLAGDAPLFSQKETQEMMTIRLDGM